MIRLPSGRSAIYRVGRQLIGAVLAGLLLGACSEPTLQSVPAITLPAVDGRMIALNDTRNGPLLVTFWSTTCRRCLEEMPDLIKLHNELAPRGLTTIAVAMPYDPPNRVLELARDRALPYPAVLDIRGDAVRAFGDIPGTPATFLFAADGHTVLSTVGATDMPALRAAILALL